MPSFRQTALYTAVALSALLHTFMPQKAEAATAPASSGINTLAEKGARGLLIPARLGPLDEAAKQSGIATAVCTNNGLSLSVEELSKDDQRYYASFCTAYYLAVVEVTSDAGAWQHAMGLIKKFNLDLTKDSIDPGKFKGIEDFKAYWEGVDKQNYGMPEAERMRRVEILSQVLSVYLTQSVDKGERVDPANLLALARALKEENFDMKKIRSFKGRGTKLDERGPGSATSQAQPS